MNDLNRLLANVTQINVRRDIVIHRLIIDSRDVKAGDCFIAYPGTQVDGRDFIDAAIKQGAVAVLFESDDATLRERANVPLIPIKNLAHVLGQIAADFFDFPSEKLDIIGVTGTNGKTSCAHYLAQALTSLNIPCGVIGTIGNGLLHQLKSSGLTTPDVISCHQQLAEFVAQDVTHVAMEVSSHALAQQRVNAVRFNTAVFTNLTQDHLDYHGTMENYADAKLKLFMMPGLREAVFNLDDDFSKRIDAVLAKEVKRISYSTSNKAADIYADAIHHSNYGISAQIKTPWGSGQLQSPLIGAFNLSNLLAVIACLCLRGHSLPTVLQILSLVRGASGRMEMVKTLADISLVVDYAHTPDALEQSLKAIKQHCQAHVWCVFGCGGDRDREKRAMMAKVAEAHADRIIVTNDNPRDEDPLMIIEDIVSGFEKKEHVQIETDRKRAIISAFEQAQAGDMILIAGKGHENYQLIKGQKFDFSDLQVAHEIAKTSIAQVS